ncbi:hypothetical protein ARMGADRAFT_1006695 [Armillaria gallica]|uniref:VHS domain-containing protein n=1 Tax=Armillaria gallica TaxID=47427 RepID=A0A2H3E9V8_ARMGA|nr:hypothetical protein ARMGADRAFT_1006695 [Armillaria gallica]
MSAIKFAREAFGREKPHSSITDWVEILTASTIAEEAYDGIPELVDAINLQPNAGPTEASRAIRKKLKHGSPHQQYRALVILKALVENCGDKFKTSFADGQLTDALKHLASDSYADKRVKKKLVLVLKSWHEQFQSDPSMTMFSNLYSQTVRDRPHVTDTYLDPEVQQRKVEEAKRKAQEKAEAKERQKLEEEKRKEEKRKKNQPKPKRAPFDFEKEKPKVLSSIVDASQASSNLVNAITLVNRETDSLQTNERVQECLSRAKLARKQIVRYIQLVENEELIGTLIETNERVINALETYDNVLNAPVKKADDSADTLSAPLAKIHLTGESEVIKLQEKQRAAVERAKYRNDSGTYADLQDINFGSIGVSSTNLQPPLRPSTLTPYSGESNEARGSLSDFSDYESSDEETHNTSTAAWRRAQKHGVDDDTDSERLGIRTANREVGGSNVALVDVEDPFADPFADEVAVGPSKKW